MTTAIKVDGCHNCPLVKMEENLVFWCRGINAQIVQSSITSKGKHEPITPDWCPLNNGPVKVEKV